jgi:hypothetical protein
MDPTIALEEARRISEHILKQTDAENEENCAELEIGWEDARALAEYFAALDGWISKGGFLPKAWVAPGPSSPIVDRLTKAERRTIELARSMIRDAAHGWATKELAGHPREVCASLSLLLGEGYDFKAGEPLEACPNFEAGVKSCDCSYCVARRES